MTTPNLVWREAQIANQAALRKALWKRVEEFTGHPLLIDWAAKLIKKENVPERNDRALAEAVLKYAQKDIKFFRESPERFASPFRTISWGIGDCDDKSVFIACILRSFRIPVKLKFISFSYLKGGVVKKINHVYPLAFLDGKWTSLESVHPWPMGTDPEDKAKSKGIIPTIFLLGDNP